LPVAEAIQPTVLSLPLHPWLPAEDAGYVVDVLESFASGRP
jgi:dTDP-4-amino-4,6-dideoxygalactose transaminase